VPWGVAGMGVEHVLLNVPSPNPRTACWPSMVVPTYAPAAPPPSVNNNPWFLESQAGRSSRPASHRGSARSRGAV